MGNEQCRSKCDTGVCECYDEKSVSKSQEDLRTAESMIPDEGLSARGPEGDVPDSIIAVALPDPAILASLIDDVCEAGVSQEEARKIVMAEWQSVVAKGSQGQFLATLEACSPERRKWLGHELAAAAKKKTQQ